MKRDKNTQDSGQMFTRRAFFVGGVQAVILTVLAGRLGWLQIVKGRNYKTLSDKNRINLKMIAPSRGEIFDRSGTGLAMNEQNFRVLVIPEQTEDLQSVLQNLQSLVDLPQKDIENVLEKASKMASFVPIEIKDNLTWEDVAKVEVNLPDLPGLSIDVGEIRTYPLAETTAHLVGYVGAVSKSDLGKDPVLSLPGFKIGKTGIERAYDKAIRGSAGTAEVEVNVRGREVRELKRYEGLAGKKVVLTVDAELQSYMQKRLSKEKSASAVVMDAHTGAVYAMVSAPGFDPNLLTRGISASKWEELLANPGFPLNNKAIGGQYPPGSTFKMVTAMAALEEGVINKNSSFQCPGHYDYGGSRFHCWKWNGHGRMDLVNALAESCDVFFYKIATDVGIDKIAEYARRFGYGHKLGFDLEEERPGLMPDSSWKMGYFGEQWKKGETVVASIGQGYIQATPLQMAVMTARLVNGGYEVKPWLAAYLGDKPAVDTSWPKMNFKKEHFDLIQQGMNKVVMGAKGTAKASQIPDEKFYMGGKTGTSQVRRITMQERRDGQRNEDLPWRLRHHALFVGYAPYNDPRYVCSVVVEHGGSGSAAAAPIARDMLYETQRRDPANIKIHNGDQGNKSSVQVPPHDPRFINKSGVAE